jgi:hypothetical protein
LFPLSCRSCSVTAKRNRLLEMRIHVFSWAVS